MSSKSYKKLVFVYTYVYTYMYDCLTSLGYGGKFENWKQQ